MPEWCHGDSVSVPGGCGGWWSWMGHNRLKINPKQGRVALGFWVSWFQGPSIFGSEWTSRAWDRPSVPSGSSPGLTAPAKWVGGSHSRTPFAHWCISCVHSWIQGTLFTVTYGFVTPPPDWTITCSCSWRVFGSFDWCRKQRQWLLSAYDSTAPQLSLLVLPDPAGMTSSGYHWVKTVVHWQSLFSSGILKHHLPIYSPIQSQWWLSLCHYLHHHYHHCWHSVKPFCARICRIQEMVKWEYMHSWYSQNRLL